MSIELIDAYKLYLENLFSRGKGILGETFISKLLKKAEKNTSVGNISLLKGIEYFQDTLEVNLIYKNFKENEQKIDEKVISDSFNKILELIDKALTMLVGKENALKLMKDGFKDAKVKNEQLLEKSKLVELIPMEYI